jgi:hypothetical protein
MFPGQAFNLASISSWSAQLFFIGFQFSVFYLPHSRNVMIQLFTVGSNPVIQLIQLTALLAVVVTY